MNNLRFVLYTILIFSFCLLSCEQEHVNPSGGFTLEFEGSPFSCPCRQAFVRAVTDCDEGLTFSYDWSIRQNNIWVSIGYYGSVATVVMPCTVGDGVEVRVDVEASNGTTNSYYDFIEAAYNWPGQQGECML